MVGNDGLDHIKEGLTVIFNYFGKKNSGPQFSAQLAIWKSEFKDFSASELRSGITKYLGSTKNPYLPMPQDVKDYMQRGGLPSAEIAWADILLLDSEYSPHGIDSLKININNPITQKVYNGREYAARKEFIANYNAVLAGGNLDSIVGKYNNNLLENIERSEKKIEDWENEILTLSDLTDKQIAINITLDTGNRSGLACRGSNLFKQGIDGYIEDIIDDQDQYSGTISYNTEIRKLYIEYIQNEIEKLNDRIDKNRKYLSHGINGEVKTLPEGQNDKNNKIDW